MLVTEKSVKERPLWGAVGEPHKPSALPVGTSKDLWLFASLESKPSLLPGLPQCLWGSVVPRPRGARQHIRLLFIMGTVLSVTSFLTH